MDSDALFALLKMLAREIAGLAMPDTYFATDSRVQRAKLYLEVSKHDG